MQSSGKQQWIKAGIGCGALPPWANTFLVLALPLATLIVYANGIFVVVYLLCMLAGYRLLKGRARLMALLGSLLCCALLLMMGIKSLYALTLLALLWWWLPHKTSPMKASTSMPSS